MTDEELIALACEVTEMSVVIRRIGKARVKPSGAINLIEPDDPFTTVSSRVRRSVDGYSIPDNDSVAFLLLFCSMSTKFENNSTADHVLDMLCETFPQEQKEHINTLKETVRNKCADIVRNFE
jgi:hypothetical protein